jgi:hypothetical protein
LINYCLIPESLCHLALCRVAIHRGGRRRRYRWLPKDAIACEQRRRGVTPRHPPLVAPHRNLPVTLFGTHNGCGGCWRGNHTEISVVEDDQGRIVETAIEARQAERGPGILSLLVISIVLAVSILGVLWFIFFRT